MPDLNANDLDQASKIIEGTARSMGVEVELMAKHGKRYRDNLEKVDRERQYSPAEAVELIKELRAGQVRRDRRGAHPHRAQRPPRRGAAARHDLAARTASARR